MDGQDFQNANVSHHPSVAKDISTNVSFEVIECSLLSLENGIVSGRKLWDALFSYFFENTPDYLSTASFLATAGLLLSATVSPPAWLMRNGASLFQNVR